MFVTATPFSKITSFDVTSVYRTNWMRYVHIICSVLKNSNCTMFTLPSSDVSVFYFTATIGIGQPYILICE